MIEQPPPDPAAAKDVLQTLAYALRYNRAGKRVSDRDIMTANAAAQHLLDALARAGYAIVRKPPLPAHAAPLPPHAQIHPPDSEQLALDATPRTA